MPRPRRKRDLEQTACLIIERYFPLIVPGWTVDGIDFVYETDRSEKARVEYLTSEQRLRFIINVAKITDTADLLQTLFHEMYHPLTVEYRNAVLDLIAKFVPASSADYIQSLLETMYEKLIDLTAKAFITLLCDPQNFLKKDV